VHADETTWRVYERPDGKDGYRWWLWVFLADDTVVFTMDPTRSASVLDTHFGIDGPQRNCPRADGWSCPPTSTSRISPWPGSRALIRCGAGPTSDDIS
jgi:hypothetical protein